MRSSRGFASTAPNLFALIRLAFASAARQSRLTLLVTVSRRIIMQKARHHPSPTPRWELSPQLQISNCRLQIEKHRYRHFNLQFEICNLQLCWSSQREVG